MKIIKVSTELEMSVHEFPEGTMREQNKVLYGLIGNGCDLVEHVMPKRLYTELKMPSSPVKEPGKCVSMLIDEEGRLKPNKANLIGSYLYEVDKHGCPIVGNILFIGEKMGDDGVEFCGISEENFSLLETELKNMITAMKATVSLVPYPDQIINFFCVETQHEHLEHSMIRIPETGHCINATLYHLQTAVEQTKKILIRS